MEPTRSGVVIVDKPKGPTSHDVVARVRRAFATREVGHAGTLDPMATGVLVVAVGEATKLVGYLTAQDKAYLATVKLGVATSSLDADGAMTETKAVAGEIVEELKAIERGDAKAGGEIERAIAREMQREEQVPPLVSAVRVGGERAYEKARRGEVVEMAPRAVTLRSLEVRGASAERCEIEFELVCSKGYFVRAFARDFAASIGTVAHLTRLRRTRSGAFSLADAVSLDALTRRDPNEEGAVNEGREHILSIAEAARRVMPSATLSSEGVTRARHGKVLYVNDFIESSIEPLSAWFDEGGVLIAIGERAGEGAWKVARGFVRGA